MLDRERIIATPASTRWLVPPATVRTQRRRMKSIQSTDNCAIHLRDFHFHDENHGVIYPMGSYQIIDLQTREFQTLSLAEVTDIAQLDPHEIE
jgi:hypothetical protein